MQHNFKTEMTKEERAGLDIKYDMYVESCKADNVYPYNKARFFALLLTDIDFSISIHKESK